MFCLSTAIANTVVVAFLEVLHDPMLSCYPAIIPDNYLKVSLVYSASKM